MRKAVIIIAPDESGEQVDVQTGEVSDYEILNALQILCEHFAKKIVKDASDIVGDSLEEIESYLDFAIKNKLI